MMDLILFLILTLGGAQATPLFDFLPPVIIDDTRTAHMPNTHTTIFFPVGKYATDVHYQIIRLPIHLQEIEKGLQQATELMHHMKNIVKGKATETPILQIINLANYTLEGVKIRYKNMILNLPAAEFSPYGSKKKRFLDLIFGIVGTAFGVTNKIEIAKINAIIAKNLHRTDMMADVMQLHENHMSKLDNQIKNTGRVLNDFTQFSPAVASHYLTNYMNTLQTVQIDVENGLEQAQLQRLSHSLFHNDVLEKVKAKIDQTARDNGYISFVSKTTDLFQIPLSYVYQPGNRTLALLLHVPLVKPEYLLNLNQYLPFPLSHDLSPNHSLTPSVGQNDILAYSGFETFKTVSQSDLAACHKMGETYFCKGRNDLRTDITETCLGSLYLQQAKGIQKNCKFEIGTAKEQVFRLSHSKWAVATQKQFTTHQVCGKNRKPVTVGPGTTISLEPGCKIRLQSHILSADSFEEEVIEPTYFTWNWNTTQIFPDLAPHQFSQAMQSLNDYGLHIVDAVDIAHHLKFENFNEPVPLSISNLFSNPMHTVTIVLASIMVLCVLYKIYAMYCKPITEVLKATPLGNYMPRAPPAYEHNDPKNIPMINLNLR